MAATQNTWHVRFTSCTQVDSNHTDGTIYQISDIFTCENALRIEEKQEWNQTGVYVTERCLICTFIRETRAKNKTRPNIVSFRINSDSTLIQNYSNVQLFISILIIFASVFAPLGASVTWGLHSKTLFKTQLPADN